jgi:hypothetical protein
MVVFDAFVKPCQGLSLNIATLTGGVVQRSIVEIFIVFRMQKYAGTADICQMCPQVSIEKTALAQNIMWRRDKHDMMDMYQLDTVTFNTTPAAFMATRALLETTFYTQD